MESVDDRELIEQVAKWVGVGERALSDFTPEVQAAVSKLLPKKRGRPVDPARKSVKAVVPDRSERTVTRFATAMRNLIEIVSVEEAQEFITASTRPNGSINVSKLLALSEAAKRIVV